MKKQGYLGPVHCSGLHLCYVLVLKWFTHNSFCAQLQPVVTFHSISHWLHYHLGTLISHPISWLMFILHSTSLALINDPFQMIWNSHNMVSSVNILFNSWIISLEVLSKCGHLCLKQNRVIDSCLWFPWREPDLLNSSSIALFVVLQPRGLIGYFFIL